MGWTADHRPRIVQRPLPEDSGFACRSHGGGSCEQKAGFTWALAWTGHWGWGVCSHLGFGFLLEAAVHTWLERRQEGPLSCLCCTASNPGKKAARGNIKKPQIIFSLSWIYVLSVFYSNHKLVYRMRDAISYYMCTVSGLSRILRRVSLMLRA